MPSRSQTECACTEIAGELVDMVTWLSEGDLKPDEFRRTVAALEARKLQLHGFHLASATSLDGTVHFSLRHAENDELCASLDVDPLTGKLTVQHTCV